MCWGWCVKIVAHKDFAGGSLPLRVRFSVGRATPSVLEVDAVGSASAVSKSVELLFAVRCLFEMFWCFYLRNDNGVR